LQNKYLK
jgi:hypothetical protein